ncbi:hypothetical protein J437_LFUL004717 [Ladona fulva]|uniref:Uncharacterized protein n=1 Tax=Ladona fulva TaxID=123851 RepID=A0A8K0NVV9_LADFU|nr:hypothetical protein J437_LFUL004717 [Ladona fulva]
MVNLAKNRASSDNISVVVVLLSTIEDILATAPPPVKEQPEALFSSDGLAPLCNPPHHYLVNGTMDGETAQFDSIHKVPSPEGAIDLTARNGLHDIMMSSFYANGAEDSRDLFSNPCDLGPETDVDLLDDDVGGRAEQLQKDEAWCGGEKVVCSEETGGIRKEEDLEVVGGGVEEEEDDSEDEDAEWKYVSVKSPGSGVVPVSHEPSLEDNPFDRRAPSGHDIDPLDFLEQSVEAGQQVVPKDSGFLELFTSKESAEKQELDENKICPELASEVVQKVELEENPNLIEDLSIEELQKQVSGGNIFSVGSLQEEFIGESKESTEEAAMESRLNPDAAEFVPISPTRNTVSETLNGVGNEFDLFKKEAEALSSVGNEFDMFRKEAEACPGEVCDEMSTIPTEIVGRPIVNEDLSKNPFDRSDLADSDVVLSSSFNYEQRNLEVMDYLGSAEESAVQGSYNFAEEDEDKENIPVCDDKENMRLSPNAEVVSAEDVALITQERELERLEETIFENVSGTSDTPGLQTADSSSLDVLKERVEFDQRFPDSEQQSESAESPNLMVCDHGQRMQSPEIPQAVEQTYVLESKIPQEEEVLVQLDDKVRSLEPVEASLEPVTETKSSVEEPVVVLQSLGNLDFTEIEQDLLGVNENYETFGKQGMKQDLIESELVPVNVGMQIIEEGLVPANENQEENVAHTHDDFEIIQSPEKVEEKSIENVSQEIENDPKDFHQTYEKLSHELKEEIGKSYETAEFHDSTQKASEDSYSQEEIASAVQNLKLLVVFEALANT